MDPWTYFPVLIPCIAYVNVFIMLPAPHFVYTVLVINIVVDDQGIRLKVQNARALLGGHQVL